MTTRSGPDAVDSGGDRPDPGLDAIMSERRQLINLAYRLLGSLAEAEDAVQETYARWYAMSRQQQDAIESPGAWLTTVASRICLNLLGSARARRETYVGEWIPEPLPERTEWINGRPGDTTVDPADRVTLDESVSMAFLVVLDPDATAIADGGGLATTFLHPIEGGEQIARAWVEIAHRASSGDMTFLERMVNGQLGLVAQQDGVTVTVFAFEVAGDRIKHIWVVRNPEKLRRWTTG
jgi:Sigma-70 region 2